MGYIYRYIDKSDNTIKYVGIVWGKDRALSQRIKEHFNDSWTKTSEWDIQYIEEDIETRTDAEYFEAHYISLYGTDNYFNKSKSGWGVSKFLPDREGDWKSFCVKKFPFDDIFKELLNAQTKEERSTIYRNGIHQYEEMFGYGKSNFDRKINKMLSVYLFGNTEVNYVFLDHSGAINLNIPHIPGCCEIDISTGRCCFNKKWVELSELVSCINEYRDELINMIQERRLKSLEIAQHIVSKFRLQN